MLSILGKNLSGQHFENFFLLFPENRLSHFMKNFYCLTICNTHIQFDLCINDNDDDSRDV